MPEVDTVPILSFRVHELALEELQVSVDEEPRTIEVGFAERDAVGAWPATCTEQVAIADPPVLAETVTCPVFVPRVEYALETFWVEPVRPSVPDQEYVYVAPEPPDLTQVYGVTLPYCVCAVPSVTTSHPELCRQRCPSTVQALPSRTSSAQSLFSEV